MTSFRGSIRWWVFAFAACAGGPNGGGSDGGEIQTEQAAICVDRCDDDSQCPAGLACEDGKCTCSADEPCQLSGSACETNGDCSHGERCVVWHGTKVCAARASEEPPACGSLLSPSSSALVQLADGSGEVRVCPEKAMRCRLGECLEPCGPCGFPPGTTLCDEESGKCRCTTEPEDSCTKVLPGTRCLPDGTCGCTEDDRCYGTEPTCDLDTGRCICLSDEDCHGSPCINGVCSCTSNDECNGLDFVGKPIDRDHNPATPGVCEPL